MPRPLIAAGLCLALCACASAAQPKLPVCDGRHPRPANRGLVAPAAWTATPSAVDPLSFRPCGARA